MSRILSREELEIARDAFRLAAEILDIDSPGGRIGLAANHARHCEKALQVEIALVLGEKGPGEGTAH